MVVVLHPPSPEKTRQMTKNLVPYWLMKGNLFHVHLFWVCLPTIPILVVHFLHLVPNAKRGKKRCQISNLHYRAFQWQPSNNACVFACAYLCTGTSTRVYVYGQDMFSLAMIQCPGRQIKSCLKASPARPVTWRDNAVNAMSSCHRPPLACRLAGLSLKWTTKLLENVNFPFRNFIFRSFFVALT